MTTRTREQRDMPKAYDPKQVEGRLYRFWEERGYFTPQIDHQREPFVIIMPPPNVTGELHLGHALVDTIQDLMIRWHRMRGEPTLWLPGVDHAAIAVQNVVERELAAEGLTRHDLGREHFLERVWEFINTYRPIIFAQHKRLGASADWTRERFTMDRGPSRAVRTTFVNLYNKGLIYRGERIINWCPRCTTALSDLEVVHQEHQSHLWYVRYPLVPQPGAPGPTEYITVATTRPETILGDAAVAVNPGDQRYQGIIGRQALLPVIGREVPIVADEAVDPAFGTGAVKITPAHDPVDFEVAQRHALPLVNILNPDGTLNQEAGPYRGQDRFAAREALVDQLMREDLLVKIEPYTHAVGHCERCDTVVEPWASEQWFVRIAPLAVPAIQAVVDGRISFVPERFTKTYLNWMENIRDWCISRQLWWGHRIPVWYCGDCDHLTVAVEDPTRCAGCGGGNLRQDEDVLDTWFSSALWPHSTLGWPDEVEDLRYFYPTTVMETAYEIIFFWVARMIMMGLENTGDIPFRTVYIHGLVRDEDGAKMSKSKGNVVDPLEVADRYGTDALRYALITGSSPGNDMRLSDQRVEASRNFANKLWNAARFVISGLSNPVPQLQPSGILATEDRWILSRLYRLIASVDRLLTDFQFGEAARQVHDFLWNEYCDWYIELAKIRLRAGSQPSPLPVLVHVLEQTLRLLHPFMPFITEEIWQNLLPLLDRGQNKTDSIMIVPYPSPQGGFLDEEAEQRLELVVEVTRAIRNARAEHGVEASRSIDARVYFGDPWVRETVAEYEAAIKILARLRTLELWEDQQERPHQAIPIVLDRCEVYLPLAGMLDLAAERERLERELRREEGELARLDAKLANSEFESKAPTAVVERERERHREARERVERLRARLATMGTGTS